MCLTILSYKHYFGNNDHDKVLQSYTVLLNAAIPGVSLTNWNFKCVTDAECKDKGTDR